MKPAISEKAKQNHNKLFANQKSTLEESDPEFFAFFENFALDEVFSQGKLDRRTRLMMILACLISQQSLSQYEIHLNSALDDGITPVEAKEILYQTVPYIGIAKAYDFFQKTNEVLKNRGVQLPLEGQSTTNSETRFGKGLEVQKEIFGGAIDSMRENSPKDLLHIQDFLSANCFGDTYTRKGLDLPTREILTLAVLLSLGGCEAQLKAHIAGNKAVGNNRDRLIDGITALLPYVGYPRTLNALACLNEVLPAAKVRK